jgi:hypothetical protein
MDQYTAGDMDKPSPPRSGRRSVEPPSGSFTTHRPGSPFRPSSPMPPTVRCPSILPSRDTFARCVDADTVGEYGRCAELSAARARLGARGEAG